ncbi:MAG: DUF6362 family protein [Opitutales bacterium]
MNKMETWTQEAVMSHVRRAADIHKRLKSASRNETRYCLRVMRWLNWVEPNDQQILWLRAGGVPWETISERFQKGRGSLEREETIALIGIAAGLNRLGVDPEDPSLNV